MVGKSHSSTRLVRLAWYVFGIGLVLWLILLCVLPVASRDTLLRTLALGLSSSIVAIPLGALTAWVCLSRGAVSRCLWLTIVSLSLLPLVIHVTSWDAAFGKLGWLTELRGDVLTPMVSGWLAASWIHGVAATPQVALIFIVFAWNDQTTYEEQALVETSAWNVFWRITLRRYLPVVMTALLWVLGVCAREIAVTDLYQIETVAEQVYLGYSLNNNTLIGSWSTDQLSSAAGLDQSLVIVSILVQSFLCFAFFVAVTDSTDSRHSEHATGTQKKGSRIRVWVGAILLVVLAATPTLNTLARASFYIRLVDGTATPGFDLQRIPIAITRAAQDYADELTWSILIAVAAATLVLSICLLLAFWVGNRFSRRLVFTIAIAIGFAIPGPVLGSTLVWLFSIPSGSWFYWLTDYTIFCPVIAVSIFCWPVCSILVWCLLQRVSAHAIEGAQLDGAGYRTLLWEFGIKANWLALLGSWVVIFMLAFGELAASSMVRPAGMDTVPRKMLGDLHAGVDELTAGITIVITLAVFAVVGLASLVFELNSRANGRK